MVSLKERYKEGYRSSFCWYYGHCWANLWVGREAYCRHCPATFVWQPYTVLMSFNRQCYRKKCLKIPKTTNGVTIAQWGPGMTSKSTNDGRTFTGYIDNDSNPKRAGFTIE